MLTTADAARTADRGAGARPPEKGRTESMTMKERLQKHREIERENERKLAAWKQANNREAG